MSVFNLAYKMKRKLISIKHSMRISKVDLECLISDQKNIQMDAQDTAETGLHCEFYMHLCYLNSKCFLPKKMVVPGSFRKRTGNSTFEGCHNESILFNHWPVKELATLLTRQCSAKPSWIFQGAGGKRLSHSSVSARNHVLFSDLKSHFLNAGHDK